MDEIKLLKRKRKVQTEGNRKLLIPICADLSDLYMKSGQFEQAIDEYKLLANIYKYHHNQIEYAKVNRAIGEAYLGVNNYKKALEHQKVYLDIAITEKNDVEVQRAYATIGHIYLTTYLETQSNLQENLNAAYKYFMKSMRVCESLSEITKLEKADMQARLLSNLGLVKESSGDYNKAVELFTTSINICKSNDIYEQLYRGYMSMASLFDKKGDSAKVMHHYNLAIDVSKKLKENVDLMCAALLAKAEALIKLGDFYTAKKSLYKSYKLNSPNLQERKIIEKYLRTVVIMSRTEDQLVIANDNTELKKLYEKMGDYACILKNYSKALEYYKLMLVCAEKSGISGRELASCYYSLAETYKDNKMYAEAVEYFEKEYMLCTELKDNLNTLSNIADTKEAGGYTVEEIKAVYNRGIENCRMNNNLKEEKRMISRCIVYLKRVNKETEAQVFQQQLNSLDMPSYEESSSSDSDMSDSDLNKDDVDLNNITDISDESDIEQGIAIEGSVITGKRKSKIFTVRKNCKGESQLHVAVINGKIPVVKHLLEQGHPVNVRDNTGWLPIHEACNHGYYEIVKILLDKGAVINDRGGMTCEGITPIFDAANNGHVKIVELLLNRGASVTKSDNGNTPLNVLKLWHQKYPFDGEDYNIYQKVVHTMTLALKKVGQSVTEEVVVDEQIEDCEEHTFEEIPSEKSDEEDESEPFSKTCSPDLLNEYQDVMKNLRKKSDKVIRRLESTQNVGKRSALINENDFLEDWIEDDIHQTKTMKKRKIGSFDSVVTSSTKNNFTSRNSSPAKRLSDENVRFTNEDIDDIMTENLLNIPTSKQSPTKQENTNKRKSQSSLLDSGFNRSKTSSDINRRKPTLQKHRSSEYAIKQQKITSFGKSKSSTEDDFTVQQSFQSVTQIPSATQTVLPTQSINKTQDFVTNISMSGDLMVFVDVKIEGKVFRMPVLLSQIQTNTIGWLADQAAQKYAKKECSKPCLELETMTGVLLSDEDPLSLLFPLGTTQAETVVGRITKLYLTPLGDRYKEACFHMKEAVNESLLRELEEVSVTLNLENKGFTSRIFTPLCKALNHQTSLLNLNLSGNFLDIGSMVILCNVLPSLVNLSSLNLRCTGLTNVHLTEIVKMFSVSTRPILDKLKQLDVSNNYLSNKSFGLLADITKYLQLENLNMSNIGLSKNIVLENYTNIKLHLPNVSNLNISDNQLNTIAVERFLSWTRISKLVHLNVSRNVFTNFNLRSGIENILEENVLNSLEYLNLSRCKLQDNDLYSLLRMCSGRLLEKIDVSFNGDLTGISLRRLLESPNLEEINVIGCSKIFEYFPEDVINIEASNRKKLKIFANLSIYDVQINSLINNFKNLYQQALIEKGDNLVLMYSEKKDM